MSLETAIANNTSAIEKMTELLTRALAGEIPTKPVIVEKVELIPDVKTSAEPEAKEVVKTLAEADDDALITYEETAALVMKVAKDLGKHTALGVLETFGLSTLKQADKNQYLSIAAECEKALQGV